MRPTRAAWSRWAAWWTSTAPRSPPDRLSAGAPPLPESLGDVCALVNNIPLPLFSVSPGQIVAQLPYISGGGSLVVHNSGGVSAPFSFTIQGQAPAIFQSGGIVQVIRDDDNEPVDFTNPIHPNSRVDDLCHRAGTDDTAAGFRNRGAGESPGGGFRSADGDTRRRLLGGDFGSFGARPDWSLYDQRYGARESPGLRRARRSLSRRAEIAQLTMSGW